MCERAKGSGVQANASQLQRPKRLQDELDAADTRLRHTAQNFSVEWKAFLAYAMKIKQETADFASFPDKNALEDLLLHSQSGLSMMREMQTRRDDKWSHVLPWELAARGHDQTHRTQENTQHDCTVPGQHFVDVDACRRDFYKHYKAFLHRHIRMCYCYLTRQRLSPTPDLRDASGKCGSDGGRGSFQHRAMTKRLQVALVRLQKLGPEDDRKSPPSVLRSDMESYLRFLCLKHAYFVVLDRFLIRVRWMLQSHRYHIRQRMLDICQQQQARHVALSPSALLEKAKVSLTMSCGVQCPRFPLTVSQVESELLALCASLGFSSSGPAMAIKLRVDDIFEQVVLETVLERSIHTDSSDVRSDCDSLIEQPLVRSRWSLLQLHSVLPDVSSSGRHPANMEPSGACQTPTNADALLFNEWNLMQLSDAAYLKARLEAQSKTHVDLALLDFSTAQQQPAPTGDHAAHATVMKAKTEAVGLTGDLPAELLEAFHKARLLVCRRKRQSLLRALNYLHYLRYARQDQATTVETLFVGRKSFAMRPVDQPGSDQWAVEQQRIADDIIVLRNHHEFVFDEAWRDFAALEGRLLGLSSAFIEKEQRLHFMDTQVADTRTTTGIVLAIDRMQVLCDAFDCETQFQHAKIQLVLQLVSTGHEFARVESDSYMDQVFESRPLIDHSQSYFSDSYANEMLLLELRRQLASGIHSYKERVRAQDRDRAAAEEETWLHDAIAMDQFASQLAAAERDVYEEANAIWFVSTAVSEYHALQQALYEKMIVLWKGIISAEVPAPSQPSLEVTRDSMLRGQAWCVTLSPALISNACLSFAAAAKGSPSDEECLMEAIDLLQWRRRLGREVYETRVLEELYEFQIGFVDLLESRKIDDPSLFACDAITSETSSSQDAHNARALTFLVPILQLLRAKADESLERTRRPDRHKQTARDWLEAALREWVDPGHRWVYAQELRIQTTYKNCLADKVKFHNLVAREIVEFAAASPFFFLASSIASQGASANDTTTAMATTNLRAVKWKYMDEIVARIRDVANRVCTPHWVPLTELHAHLLAECEFTEPPVSSETDAVADEQVAIVNRKTEPSVFVRLETLCERWGVSARLVVALDDAIRPLRNETMLMKELFPNDDEARCALTNRLEGATQTSPPTTSSLSSWLNQKLEQLSQDLKAKKETQEKNEGTPRDSTQRSSFLEAAADSIAAPSLRISHSTSDDTRLLLEMPSSEQLVEWFVMHAKPVDCPNERLQDQEDAVHTTLRALIGIYTQFGDSLALLRVETSLGFHVYTHHESSTQQRRRLSSSRLQCSTASVSTGHELLKNWQTAFHRSIKRFHGCLVERFDPHVVSKVDLFETISSEEVRRRYKLTVFREELHGALDDLTIEWSQRIRCATVAAMVGAFAIILPNAATDGEPQCLLPEQRALQQLLSRTRRSCSGAPDVSFRNDVVFVRLYAIAHDSFLQRFWQTLQKAQDTKHLETLGDWLDVVFVHIRDHTARRARASTDLSSLEPSSLAVSTAVTRYVELTSVFDRYYGVQAETNGSLSDQNEHEGEPSDGEGEEAVDKASRRVSGTALRMRTPPGLREPRKTTPTASLIERVLAAVCSGGRVPNSASWNRVKRKGLEEDAMTLPTITRLTLHLEILRVRLTVQWMDDDIARMQTHYEVFLAQKHKFHLHQQERRRSQHTEPLAPGSPRPAILDPDTITSFQKRLLDLSPYYRPALNDASRAGSGGEGEFVIPAQQMAGLLHAFTVETNTFYDQILSAEMRTSSHLQEQCTSLRKQVDGLHGSLESHKQDEVLRREAFAVDKSYKLHFQLDKQRQELGILQNRLALEQQILKAELADEFERRLRDMHVQLLAKQQKFEEYRHVMQHDLKQQLHVAQSHLVQQLVDHSGAMSVETKASFLESLQGQVTQNDLQTENVALKQTILGLQTLYEMQEQTRVSQSEKERMSQDTQRMREAQLVNENTHLQHQIGRLEAEMAKLSQDRTLYQIKWANLQKQHDAEALRRRDAKIRALSAPYRRHSRDGMDDLGVVVATADLHQRVHPKHSADHVDEDDAFERLHAVRIRSPSAGTPRVAALTESTQENDLHAKNTTRHYQNELRRLQQQLAKEIKLKSTLMEQVTSLKANVVPVDKEEGHGDEPIKWHRPPRGLDRAAASPRTRAASASVCSPQSAQAKAAALLVVPKRPSTSSFSPRRVDPATVSPRSRAMDAHAPASPAATIPSLSNRKFDVQPREPSVVKIGGIAGVQNTLATRERLPYR